jgi:septum site-determining protein MinC
MAFVIVPEAPLPLWLGALDAQMYRSPGFFETRPVIIDFAALNPDDPGTDTLIAALEGRGLSVIDVENAGDLPSADPWRRRLVGGRDTGVANLPAEATPAPRPADDPPPAASLTLDDPVRSGQSVVFTKGDVTANGFVSSGAEILAGGSIHIYGALRGRAIAGALGDANARIFCQKFEAELVSIDGYYLTADDFDPALRGRAVQIRLLNDALSITPLG